MRKARAGTEATVREFSKPYEQWSRELPRLQYSVLRRAHTERPFTGAYVQSHQDGFYRCAGCGSKLFSSDAKFDSGTGWPSFDELVEARPPRARIALSVRAEQLAAAAGASVETVLVALDIRASERPLGVSAAQDAVLQPRQLPAPLLVRLA